MFKQFKTVGAGVVLALLLGQAHALTTPEYNIARGLSPEAKGQSISVLKPFKGEFRILGSKQYTSDEQAKFSPIDFAVSYGLFAHPQIASQIKINQYDRYLNWSLRTLPVPPEQAMKLVSNMHIIPANPDIAKQITQVKRGDLVRLKGELVEVRDKNLVWTSSLAPGGVGDGACEVFRVSSIQWIERQNI